MAVPEESQSNEAQADPMGDHAESRDVETVETSKDPLLGNREGTGMLRVEDLSMRHYWRLSTIMGMADILLDVDKYFTYMLLINRFGCDFQAYFGALYMCYTVAYLAWSPLTGVWSDLLHRHIVSLLVFCSGALTCIYLVMILLPVPKGLLVWLYLAKCMLHMQMSSAGWKAIKIYVQRMFGSSILIHEQVLNRIGTLGDLATETYEIGVLVAALIAGVWFGNYQLVSWILYSAVLFISGTVFTLAVSLWYSHGRLIHTMPEEADLKLPFARPVRGGLRRGLGEVWDWLGTRLRYFFSSSILTNCVMLSMVSSCFEYMFDGPVALTRATLVQTEHGLCHGTVDFILVQTVILQIMYLAGGAVYFLGIMRLHPAVYYGTVYPLASALFMGGTVLQFFPMPAVASAVVISMMTVMAYYVSIYNTYVLSGSSKAEYFGFVQAIYSLGVGASGFLPSLLQVVRADERVLLLVAFGMAAWGMLQSILMWRQRTQFDEDTAKADGLI